MKTTKTTQIAPQEKTMAERFTNKVVAEFASGVGEVALTKFQLRLAQNYFMACDTSLRQAEEKRLKKDAKYRDKIPAVWANTDMEGLARNVVAAARIGFDPMQSNHINLIPYKNNKTEKYDIGFIPGYRGIELKAKKYGLDTPDAVTTELVYSKDKFKVNKKDATHLFETYEFEIVNAFDRGEIIGGFYYHSFSKAPEKNKIVAMPIREILKRKPKYASTEFWGGEKPIYKNGKKTNEMETVEGWYDKMCYKTIVRAAYNDITIDSQKIDNDYLALKQMEDSFAESEVAREIAENANGEVLNVEFTTVDGAKVNAETGEMTPTSASSPPSKGQKQEQPQTAEPEYTPTDEELSEMAAETGGPNF